MTGDSSFCIQTEKAEEFKEHVLTPLPGDCRVLQDFPQQRAQNQSRGKGDAGEPSDLHVPSRGNWEEL